MKRSWIRRISKEKAHETKKYRQAGPEWFATHEFCEVPFEVHDCTIRATTRHHMKRQQGKMMNDQRYWLATCLNGHIWIEDNKNKARAMGLILYK